MATGGPDPVRGIYPILLTVTAEGAADVAESDVSAATASVLAERSEPRT